jgi:hypothetical protein
MSELRQEMDYYPEIAVFIGDCLRADLSQGPYSVLVVYGNCRAELEMACGNKNISEGLKTCYQTWLERLDGLKTDILVIACNTDTWQSDMVVIEVKLRAKVGLTEYSQMLGYCLVSGAGYGLLVNVDAMDSPALQYILNTNAGLTTIVRKYGEGTICHRFGVMEWSSVSKQFAYTNRGAIQSIPQLAELIDENH